MSIVLLGSTSGSCTLQEQAVAGTTTLTLPTFNGTVGLLVSGTAVASTSGTSIDFTGLPAGVRRITVMFQNVSTTSASNYLIRIGAGSIVSTGYLGGAAQIPVVNTNSTTGFMILNGTGTTANVIHGSLSLFQISTNNWVASGVFANSDAARMQFTAGSLSLGGTLDQVRITTVNGTDTFDAGTINILYE
jgi:hypothetical protein